MNKNRNTIPQLWRKNLGKKTTAFVFFFGLFLLSSDRGSTQSIIWIIGMFVVIYFGGDVIEELIRREKSDD
jgi:hypothetical protein